MREPTKAEALTVAAALEQLGVRPTDRATIVMVEHVTKKGRKR